jgi:hypothetical protein
MFNHVPIKHKQKSFMSKGGKFKLYPVPNGLLFSTPTQRRFLFERMIHIEIKLPKLIDKINKKYQCQSYCTNMYINLTLPHNFHFCVLNFVFLFKNYIA